MNKKAKMALIAVVLILIAITLYLILIYTPPNPLVGTWEDTSGKTWTFTADNVLRINGYPEAYYEIEGETVHIYQRYNKSTGDYDLDSHLSYTYSIDGETLTLEGLNNDSRLHLIRVEPV